MSAAIEMPTPINFSDNAVKKVKELIEEEGTPDLKLRVFVSGGGCSGMQYGFTFEESINEDDTKVEKDNVMLLIDPMSLQYLTGAEIDYQEPKPINLNSSSLSLARLIYCLILLSSLISVSILRVASLAPP